MFNNNDYVYHIQQVLTGDEQLKNANPSFA